MSRGGAAVAFVVSVLAAAGCGSDPSASPAPDAVEVRAAGCSAVDTLATGTSVGDGLVLTVAHALHGADSVTANGRPATVVALDDRLDAALLAVRPPTPDSGPVALADRAPAGPARVVTIDGPRPTTVSRVVGASVDVDGTGATSASGSTFVRRRVLELSRSLEAGDSGAPVVDRRSQLIGMVFATSTEGERSYAVAVDELAPFVRQGRASTTPVDLGPCR